MTPSALVISPTDDEERVGYSDAQSVAIGFERAGYSVTFATRPDLIADLDQLDVGSYDLITYQIPGSALHLSSVGTFNLFMKLHREAKDGALTFFYCDITFPVDPNIWHPELGPAKSKVNLTKDRPVRVIGSFSSRLPHLCLPQLLLLSPKRDDTLA